MRLDDYLAAFGRTMEDAGHNSSWAVSGVEVRGVPGKMFTFVTTDTARAEAAMRVLGAAGLLCETPLAQWGETPPDDSMAVQAMVTGLRGIGGAR